MANNTIVASDSFSGGSLAVGWTALFGISESQIIGSSPYYSEPVATSANYGQMWTGTTFPNDQSSEVTVHTYSSESGTTLSLNLRMQSGAYSGYQADIANGTAIVSVITAGSKVQLGSTVTSITFAAGDVWNFQAAGPLLSLYLNGKYIFSFWDLTYTSGNPGFCQESTVNITHVQVASWRGYNLIQQDGIWTKQGTWFSPVASELGGTTQGIQNPWIILEGSPQILTGSNPVYKMWFITAVSGSAFNVGYAESYTAAAGSWVRYSGNPIISGAGYSVTVWKNAGTYYLFCNSLIGTIALFTSANGMTGWTSVGAVLVKGTSGLWDDHNIQQLAVQFLDTAGAYGAAGTAYALYSAFGGTGGQGIGQVTAVSPFTTWTKYAGNPVLANCWAMGQSYVDGSDNYYFWSLETYAGNTNLDPTDGIRIQSVPPFTTWTNRIMSIHHTQQYEGLNSLTGGSWGLTVLPMGNTTMLISEGWTLDSVSLEGYQFNYQTVPVPITQLILSNEDGCVQIASDGFTSGTGNLSANWTTPTTGTKLQIVAGDLVEASATSTNCYMYYSGSTFSANQYSEVTIHTLAASQYALPMVRMQASGLNGYYPVFHGATGSSQGLIYINKTVGGANTPIGSAYATLTPQVGDVFRMSAVGNSPVTLSLYQNGFQFLQVQDWSNAFPTGNPGVYIYAPTLASADKSLGRRKCERRPRRRDVGDDRYHREPRLARRLGETHDERLDLEDGRPRRDGGGRIVQVAGFDLENRKSRRGNRRRIVQVAGFDLENGRSRRDGDVRA